MSCYCVTYNGVDDAIAALITASEKEAILDPVDASNYRTLLSVVRQVPDAAPKYLGRLELIYRIAQHLLAKATFGLAQVKAISFASSGSKRMEPEMSEESDEQSSEDLNDILQTDIQDGRAELDWDW